MKAPRHSRVLGIVAACLLIGVAVSIFSRGSDPATRSTGSGPSGASKDERSPGAPLLQPLPPPAPVKPPIARVRPLPSAQASARLDREFRETLTKQGVAAAFALIKQILEKGPSEDPSERIRRSGALRYLAYLCSLDDRYRPETEALLQKYALDPDKHVRRVSLACLLDCPTLLQDERGGKPFWALLPEDKLAKGPALNAYALKLSGEARSQALQLLGERCLNEPEVGNRYALMHLLAANPDPRNLPVLARAALEERHEDTRYWAIEGFGRLPPSDEARLALQRISQTEISLRLREMADHSLVRLGVVDDAIVSRLLQSAPEEPGNLDTAGAAYALDRNPSLGAHLRTHLESEDPQTRILATKAIGLTKDPGFIPFLEDRRRSESDEAVRKGLDASLRALRKLPGNP